MNYKQLVKKESPLSFCKKEMYRGRICFTIYSSSKYLYTLSDSFISESDAWKKSFEMIFG